jgi:hypothetical protein
MSECVVTTPPALEEGKVVFSVVHNGTGRVFRCEMKDFDDVSVTGMPRGATPWADGDIRAEVAEEAVEHAQRNHMEFRLLFEKLAAEQAEEGSD